MPKSEKEITLEKIITVTLRAMPGELANNLSRNNALLEFLTWEEVKKVTVPEFIEGRAKGYMKMKNGNIYRRIESDGRRVKDNNRTAR